MRIDVSMACIDLPPDEGRCPRPRGDATPEFFPFIRRKPLPDVREVTVTRGILRERRLGLHHIWRESNQTIHPAY